MILIQLAVTFPLYHMYNMLLTPSRRVSQQYANIHLLLTSEVQKTAEDSRRQQKTVEDSRRQQKTAEDGRRRQKIALVSKEMKIIFTNEKTLI